MTEKLIDTVKVIEEDEELFKDRYELMKTRVNQLIDDWLVRDYPKGRTIEIIVKTKKANHKDVWTERYQYHEKMDVYFVAEIGTKKPE